MLRNLEESQAGDKRIRKMQENRKGSDHVRLHKGILFTRENNEKPWKVIIPETMQNRLIKETHQVYGHPGKERTYHILFELCSMKKMYKKVAQVVRSCDACQKAKPINFRAKGIQISHKPTEILETLSIDVMGPLPTEEGE